MTGDKWTIYWEEYSSDTYLYGSEVFYHKKDDVEFKNSRMPSGTIIKQWYSKTNYQMQKIEPALPMIDGECSYRIIVHMDCLTGENCLLRLVFYDKYGKEADSIIIKDKEADFQCPLRTYSYKLQLVNGGATQFHFHSIIIREIRNGTEERFQKNKENSFACQTL